MWHISKPVTSKIARLLALLPAMALFLVISNNKPAIAQATNDPWTPPINLSHSGSTSNPVAVRDSNGIIHVIWQDKFRGYVYTRLQDGQWRKPVEIAFPFEEVSPVLLPDSKGSIHAFWIDADDSIGYTRLTATAQGLVWDKTQFIAESALSFEATIGSNDVIHVVYVRPKEATDVPAGVYYRQSRDSGTSWTTGKLLYSSLYIREMNKADANISIAEDRQGTRIYAAWDNRPRKQIFFSVSSDGGSSWSDPYEVQGADAESTNTSPFGVKVGAINTNVVLIWQKRDSTNGCILSYQSSSDGGESWRSPEIMLGEVIGCPQKNNLISNGNGLLFLMTSIQDQWYLAAWNGSQWSNPQFQSTLTGFVDPETQDMVLYACQKPILSSDGQMFVVGCDEGNGGDIWATSTTLTDSSKWFPPPSIWSDPVMIQENSSPIFSPVIIADSQGRFHALWIQPDDTNEAIGRSHNVIYHSGYDGFNWSTPVRVLSSPTGDADQLSVKIDDNDRLMVSWREKESGFIYFSWANAQYANSASEWAKPVSVSLPELQSLASSPFLTVDGTGKIIIVYAIPINEGRGIYLTTSTDIGQTWSEPEKIVDAVVADWEMVDQPQIDISADGRLGVIWKVFRVIGDSSPLGVYYAQSENNGQSWSQPTTVVEGQVLWNAIFSTSDTAVHLVWQEKTFAGFVLRQQISIDGGRSWSRRATIAVLGTSQAPASLVKGTGDHFHLISIVKESLNRIVLKDWIWRGNSWFEDTDLNLPTDTSSQIREMSSAISPLGKLGVVYSRVEPGKMDDEEDVKLIFLGRPIEVTFDPLTAVPTRVVPATETMSPTVIETATPIPLLAVAQSPIAPTQPVATGLSRREIIVGGVIGSVGLILATVLAVQFIFKRRL
jgi:hypothetical protein